MMPWPWHLFSQHKEPARVDAEEARAGAERAARERVEAEKLAHELEMIRSRNGITPRIEQAFRARPPGANHG